MQQSTDVDDKNARVGITLPILKPSQNIQSPKHKTLTKKSVA